MLLLGFNRKSTVCEIGLGYMFTTLC
ncbi:hypothetical protein MASSI9I_90353 [Massilia sp. 9I]|nr:hypothetical protein MASSI9I_90353 [Massilia sp. 9I]